MKKKRGAPPGNRNALKHGFYSDQFKQAECRALNSVPLNDLTEEIMFLRVEMHRYLEAENLAGGDLDYKTRLSALRAVSLAVDNLARLVRLQTLINLQAKEREKLENVLLDVSLDDIDEEI